MNILSPKETLERVRQLARHYVLYSNTPPADAKAFTEYVRELFLLIGTGLITALGVGAVLVWPTDRLLFSAMPALVDALSDWRQVMVTLTASTVLLLRIKVVQRYAYPLVLLSTALAEFYSGYRFANLGLVFQGMSICFLFMLVPLPMGLAARSFAAMWMQGWFIAGTLLRAPAVATDPIFAFFVTYCGLAIFSTMLFGHVVFHLTRNNFLQKRAIGQANEKSEKLLLNILPRSIADRLKEEPQAIADRLGEVTVLFADIAGFTPLSESLAPEELVHLLNRIFSEFDTMVDALGLEKIKTIGDAYMVAGGLPVPRLDHAEAVAELALRMREAASRFVAPDGRSVEMRIGLHTGPVVAGVIGVKKFSYDLWGDTVNTASRMESHGQPGTITVSQTTRQRLGERYTFEARGPVKVKGKGEMELFFLTGRATSAKAPQPAQALAADAS